MIVCQSHDLAEVYQAGTSLPGITEVVRWCRQCGAVVVDVDVDGRTKPGGIMSMIFPRNVGGR